MKKQAYIIRCAPSRISRLEEMKLNNQIVIGWSQILFDYITMKTITTKKGQKSFKSLPRIGKIIFSSLILLAVIMASGCIDLDEKESPEENCDSKHLSLCDDKDVCENARGYWYNEECNKEEEESRYGDLKVTYISQKEVQEKYTVSYNETFKYDDDGDGTNEATLYYKGENNLVMSSDDTNKDGKVDLIFHYDDEEYLTRAIRDTDGDGELDQILHFNREEEIIKVEKIRSDDTKNSILFIILGSIIIFIVMSFWLYVTKKQPCNLRMNELNYMGRVNHQVGKRLFLVSLSFLCILVLLASPVSSLEAVIDDDCSINQDVWDRDWKKYSDLENTPYTFEEKPLKLRSPETQRYYATQSEIADAKLQIFFLRRDMEIDRLMRVELNIYKKELVDGHRDNLLRSFMRLSFLTAHVTVEAVIAGKSVGDSYNNIVAPPSHVSAAASSLKIMSALDTMAKDSETPSLEDDTQDATEVVKGAGANVVLDAVESLGDAKTVGAAFVTQTIGAIPIKYKGKEWMLTEEDFEILEEEHLELKRIDMAWADSFKANLVRMKDIKKLEAQVKELEKELAEREAKVKSMLKDSLVANCKDGKKEKCDFEHLNLCKNEKDCDYIGRYWYGNQCNENPEEDASGGDTSAGEFDCPIPTGARHIVGSYHDSWEISVNKVGPYQTWYNTEKTKKHLFICYNAEGKRHGVDRVWYEDGTLAHEGNGKDGKLHGVQRLWRRDGTLLSEINYKDGKFHGVHRAWWYEDGTLKSEYNYKDGGFHGVQRRWSEDGTLMSECIYENGKVIECKKIYYTS